MAATATSRVNNFTNIKITKITSLACQLQRSQLYNNLCHQACQLQRPQQNIKTSLAIQTLLAGPF
jgi:hypothetical protein